jgi:hypothetical protein
MKTNWPTPLSRDWKDGAKIPPSVRKGTKGHSLATKVLEEEEKIMWPTPRASNPGSRPNGKGGKILSEEVLIAEGLRERGKKKNDK